MEFRVRWFRATQCYRRRRMRSRKKKNEKRKTINEERKHEKFFSHRKCADLLNILILALPGCNVVSFFRPLPLPSIWNSYVSPFSFRFRVISSRLLHGASSSTLCALFFAGFGWASFECFTGWIIYRTFPRFGTFRMCFRLLVLPFRYCFFCRKRNRIDPYIRNTVRLVRTVYLPEVLVVVATSTSGCGCGQREIARMNAFLPLAELIYGLGGVLLRFSISHLDFSSLLLPTILTIEWFHLGLRSSASTQTSSSFAIFPFCPGSQALDRLPSPAVHVHLLACS